MPSRTTTVRLLSLAGLCFASALAPPSRAADSAVILQYHHVGDTTPPATSVTGEQFDAHLDYLESESYEVWPLEKIVAHLTGKRDLPEKCVAITFDDAYRSVYTEAFPRLHERKWPLTVFVTTHGVDQGWQSYMTWQEMRELAGRGVRFAPHGHAHEHMTRRRPGESEEAWTERVTEDIQRCRMRLGEELGEVADLFAYPYGEYDARLKEIVRGLDLIGFGQQSGAVWTGSDFGALPRFALSVPYANLPDFITRVRSLPLPVLSAQPEDPVLPAGADRPTLRLELAAGDYQIDQLACYATGQGRIEVRRMQREGLWIEIVPGKPVPMGRSRYNCTAPHRDGGRYYWFSQLWIRGEEHGD